VVASKYMATQQFVQGLRSDIANSSRSLSGGRPLRRTIQRSGRLFSGGPQNEPVAVEDLMAYMVKRGYRFDKAKTGGEQVYQTLYASMVDYYLDFAQGPGGDGRRGHRVFQEGRQTRP